MRRCFLVSLSAETPRAIRCAGAYRAFSFRSANARSSVSALATRSRVAASSFARRCSWRVTPAANCPWRSNRQTYRARPAPRCGQSPGADYPCPSRCRGRWSARWISLPWPRRPLQRLLDCFVWSNAVTSCRHFVSFLCCAARAAVKIPSPAWWSTRRPRRAFAALRAAWRGNPARRHNPDPRRRCRGALATQ